jgi:hypothetical protein
MKLLAACAGAVLFSFPLLADQSACDAVPGNLLVNCGFETGNLNGWQVFNGSPVVTGNGAFAPASGNFYAQLGPGGNFFFFQQGFTVPVQRTVNISFELNSNGAGPPNVNGQIGAGLVLLDGNDFGGISLDLNSPTNGWTEFSFSSKVPAGGHALSFVIFPFSPNLAIGLDDVVLTAPAPEPGQSLRYTLAGAVVSLLVSVRRRRTNRRSA